MRCLTWTAQMLDMMSRITVWKARMRPVTPCQQPCTTTQNMDPHELTTALIRLALGRSCCGRTSWAWARRWATTAWCRADFRSSGSRRSACGASRSASDRPASHFGASSTSRRLQSLRGRRARSTETKHGINVHEHKTVMLKVTFVWNIERWHWTWGKWGTTHSRSDHRNRRTSCRSWSPFGPWCRSWAARMYLVDVWWHQRITHRALDCEFSLT